MPQNTSPTPTPAAPVAAPVTAAAPITAFPPMKVPNAPVAPASQTSGGGTTLAQIISYSKANPNTQYAQQAYKLIKSGAFDQQAQKEGVDLSWAGRPKLTDTSDQADVEGQDKGQATEETKPSLGDLDMQQLQGAAQKIIDSVQKAGTKEQHDANGTIFGEAKGVGDVLEGLLGAGSGVIQGIGAPVSAVLSKLVSMDPAALKDGQADPDPAGAATAKAAAEFGAAHPELTQNLRDAINVGGALYGGAEGLVPGGDMTLGDFAQTGKGVLADATATIKNGGSVAADAGKTAMNNVQKNLADSEKTETDATPATGVKPLGKVLDTGPGRSAIGQAMGVQPSTIHEILHNPDFTPEKMALATRENLGHEVQEGINKKVTQLNQMKESAAVSPRALADQVKAGLDKQEAALTARAHDYGEITGERTPGSTDGPSIKVAKNWLDKQVEKVTGRTVKNGKIDPAPSSAAAIRQPKDINTFQKFLDTHRPAFQKGTLSGNEFLNIRDDMDSNLANFDSGGTPSSDLQKAGKTLYGSLNDSYRGRFPGLEKADSNYAEQKNNLDRLRVGLIDNNGELSENAMSRIRNSAGDKFAIGDKLEELVPGIKTRVAKLKEIEDEQSRYRNGLVDSTGKLLDGAANRIANMGGLGKDMLASRLEEVAPGIGDKVRFLKAVEDINSAKGIKAGSYVKAGLALTTGPFGVAAMMLTHPDIAVPLLRKLGASAEEAAKIATDLGVSKK